MLLQTAERIFVDKGFDGARVDEIADEAGVNKRMIYVWFDNKEGLYLEVLRQSFKRLFKSNLPDTEFSRDPAADAVAIIRWYFWFLSDNPGFVRLLNWETLNGGSRAGQVLIGMMEEGLGPLQKMIRRGKGEGFIRQDLAVHKLVTLINELCLGYFSRLELLGVLWNQDLESHEKQEEMLDHIVNVVLDGIRNRE